MLWQALCRYTNPSKFCGKPCADIPICPNVVASPVQMHQSVQMFWQVLCRHTNPSKCCGKPCVNTPFRPNVVASPVQIHQSVQMLWQALCKYTNPSKCCGKSFADTPIRPNVLTFLYSNYYVYELQNSFHTLLYEVQMKTEPGRTATSTALHFLIHYRQYTGLLLPHVTVVTEVTFSHSHTRLTPGEQIIKYCLKLLPINCPYYTSS
jgi:hypothetical protein